MRPAWLVSNVRRMTIDPFAELPAHAAALRAGAYSAVDLAEFFLGRLDTLGPRFNAVVTVTRDRALREARRADDERARGVDRGPLHGIPYGAKDLIAAAGSPTTWGAAPLRDRTFEADAAVVERLTAAGAVLCAKLALVELAGGLGYRQPDASLTGPGKCAWDESRWSGCSSSGSGSAVGAGLVPFALGSETWGSIHSPANNNGVCGLRPTYGRVSRRGAMALSWTMDKLGPLCRSARDCGTVLAAIAGPDPSTKTHDGDPTAADRPFAFPPNPADLPTPPFKLAVPRGCADRAQDGVRESFGAAVKVLQDFGGVTEIEVPDRPWDAAAVTIIDCEGAAAFGPLVDSGAVWDMTAPEDRYGGYAGRMIPAVDYLAALRVRWKFAAELGRLVAPFDAVLTPARATVAQPLDRGLGDYARGARAETLGGPANAAGLPGLCVPNGTGEAGLPTGLNLVGAPFTEHRLLAVAAAYQSATDWHTRHP